MSSYYLYAWGANSHGQLGLGFNQPEEILEPVKVDLLKAENLKPEKIKKITGGAGHSLILDECGNVYSCGWNNRGQAGTNQENYYFQKLETLETVCKKQKIIDIACGWDSSMALTENGEVYAWGSNLYGQLGISSPENKKKIDHPTKVDIALKIKKISMGLRHSALLTDNLKVLMCGVASKGQIGPIANKNQNLHSFTETIPELSLITDISCGQHHTIAVTKENKVKCWGDNKYGQLGINPESVKKTFIPLNVEFKENLDSLKVHCGWTHSAILTDKKKIALWGRNTYGQLGFEITEKESWCPTFLNYPCHVKQFSLGSEHNLILTEDGNIFSWGWNEHGNCGDGTEINVHFPNKVLFPKNLIGISIGTGAGHSFAVVKSNN